MVASFVTLFTLSIVILAVSALPKKVGSCQRQDQNRPSSLSIRPHILLQEVGDTMDVGVMATEAMSAEALEVARTK